MRLNKPLQHKQKLDLKDEMMEHSDFAVHQLLKSEHPGSGSFAGLVPGAEEV